MECLKFKKEKKEKKPQTPNVGEVVLELKLSYIAKSSVK